MFQILHSKILGEGKPLLILHGFLGSGDNWITLGRKFAEYFAVHLIDARNHGRSFHDDEMDIDTMCQDILAYCDFHHIENCAIIGHSMGGKIAMHLAVHHPELVDKLIIVDIAPKSYGRRHDFILNALSAVDFSKQKTRTDIEAILMEHLKTKRYVQFLLKNVYRKSADEFAYRFNLPVFIENYGQIIDSLPVYSQYEGDTLLLKGELSDYILEKDMALIEAHFPKVICKVIPKAGHWLHAENPQLFYKEVLDFLLQ